jgi:hypothetical protein
LRVPWVRVAAFSYGWKTITLPPHTINSFQLTAGVGLGP